MTAPRLRAERGPKPWRALLVALALFGAGAPASVSGQVASPSASIPEAIRASTFDAVWNKVARSFWEPGFGGHDWGAIGARYRPQALATGDSLQFHALLDRMVAELGFSHFRVLSPEAVARARMQAQAIRGWTGAGVRVIGGQALVTRVAPGSPAALAGVGTGWVVVAIDGTRVRPETTSAHVQEMLAGAIDRSIAVDFRDAADRIVSLNLARVPLPGAFYPVQVLGIAMRSVPAQYAELETRRLDGGIAYLRLSRFVPALVPQLREAVRSFAGAPGLIVDLRGNQGGEDSVGVKLAEMLAPSSVTLMVTRTRSGSRPYRLHPSPIRYGGPVIILVDADSASASEQMTAGLQELGRVRVIGEQTAGHDLDAEFMHLPSGGLFLYATGLPMTPRGIIVEGRGVTPDVMVPLRREDLLRGRDSQLEAALAAIGRPAVSRP